MVRERTSTPSSTNEATVSFSRSFFVSSVRSFFQSISFFPFWLLHQPVRASLPPKRGTKSVPSKQHGLTHGKLSKPPLAKVEGGPGGNLQVPPEINLFIFLFPLPSSVFGAEHKPDINAPIGTRYPEILGKLNL
jgi:hypothetical protein